jgi:hypothetical protein
MNAPESAVSSITAVAEAVGGLVDGATNLPSPVRRNLFKALDQLCTAAIDIPVAYLEGKAAERRAETQARVNILGENARQIANTLQVNPQYAEIASDKYARRIVQEQINLDKVSQIAVSQLVSEHGDKEQALGASDNEASISDDWLDSFRKEACGKSTEEMQVLFGKILADEIKRPESFSIRTVKLMGQLDGKAARLFSRLCSMSTLLTAQSNALDCRVISMNAQPAQNGLREWGLSYGDLTILEEYGLIISDFNSWMDYRAVIARSGKVFGVLDYCNIRFGLVPRNPDEWPLEKELRVTGVGLSNAGKELRQIVQPDEVSEYTQALSSYFQDQGFELTAVSG